MLNWKSTCTLDSAIAPGVRFTFYKFSAGRRSIVEAELAEFRDVMRDKTLAYADSIEDPGLLDNEGKLVLNADGIPIRPGDDNFTRAQKQTKRTAYEYWVSSVFNRYLKPAQIRTYVKSIDGLLIDDKPATPELFAVDGPVELVDEAWAYIDANCGMSEEERKNSLSPSILPAQEGGIISNTTAGSVEKMDTSQSSTADVSMISASS